MRNPITVSIHRSDVFTYLTGFATASSLNGALSAAADGSSGWVAFHAAFLAINLAFTAAVLKKR